MKNCIIGLTGFDGAGKTTVANYLEREHGFTVVSFADELKRLLMILDPIVGVDEDEDGDSGEAKTTSSTTIVQTIAHESRRSTKKPWKDSRQIHHIR